MVATAIHGEEVLKKLELYEIDLLVCDVQMPVLDGISTLLKVKERYPEIKVLMLSGLEDRDHIDACIRAGADGYISKKARRAELENAIVQVAKNGRYLDRQLLKTAESKKDSNSEALSPREIQVLKQIAAGETSLQIADNLSISINTVESHRKNIFRKLNVKNQAGAIHFAIKYGLIH